MPVPTADRAEEKVEILGHRRGAAAPTTPLLLIRDDLRAAGFEATIVEGPLPLENYLATIEVREDGSACTVDWSSSFEPKGVDEEQARAMVEGIYRGGVKGLRKALGV